MESKQSLPIRSTKANSSISFFDEQSNLEINNTSEQNFWKTKKTICKNAK